MIRDSVIDWQELSALYEHADALDEPELAAWLAQLREEQHRLIPQLERMLDARAHISSGTFLEALPRIGVVERPPESEWTQGSLIGAYRLLRHLGSGGMAEVWLAERADGAFERQVAIKLLFNHPTRAQHQTFAERFKRERDILASLHHPNIAALHDAGVTPQGQPWLALEYVQGMPITASCDARRLTIAQRVEVFRKGLLAVEHAHANLIIHRDLKPSNILVTDQGEVKLLDFGIAKLLDVDSDGAVDSELTRQGGRPLTPHYASPEQLSGRKLTTASDVYSLGVVLYELLCGKRPFDSERFSSAAQIENAILVGDALPPSRQAVTETVANSRTLSPKGLARVLSGDMDAVACKALGNEIARRYASVEAFRADLDRWSQRHPVLARRSSASYRARKFYLRHKLAVLSGGISATAVLGLTVATVFAGLKAQSESARAIASRDFVVDLFSVADPQNRGRQMNAGDLLEAGRTRALESLAGQPGLQGDVLRQIGLMQVNMGDFRRADRNLAQAVALFALAGRERDWAGAQLDLAYNAFQLGDVNRAAASIAEVAPLLSPSADGALISRYWTIKGAISRSSRDMVAAIDELSRAVTYSARAHGDNHVDTIDALRELADAYGEAGRFSEALVTLEDALHRAQRNSAVGMRDMLAIDADMAITSVQAGRYAGGIERLRALLDRCDRQFGPQDEHCVVLLNYLGWLALRLDDLSVRKSVLPRLLTEAANDASPWRQAGMANLAAEMLSVDGDLGAHPALREQLRQVSASGALPPRDRTQALLSLARGALSAGDFVEAEAWAERALTYQASLARADPDIRAKARLLRGLARKAQGRPEEALEDVRTAVLDLSGTLGAQHPLVLLYRCNEAVLLRALNRRAEAARLIEESIASLSAALGDAPILRQLRRLLASLQHPSDMPSSLPGEADTFL